PLAFRVFREARRFDFGIELAANAIHAAPRDLELRKQFIEFCVLAGRTGEAIASVEQISASTIEDWKFKSRVATALSDRFVQAGRFNAADKQEYLSGLIRTAREQAATTGQPDQQFLDTLEHWILSPQVWLVAGPFAGGNSFQGFDRVLPPEEDSQPDARYEAADHGIQWHTVSTRAGEPINFLKLH